MALLVGQRSKEKTVRYRFAVGENEGFGEGRMSGAWVPVSHTNQCGSDVTTLTSRPMTTPEDLEAIKQLKYRYLRTLDTKQWDDFEACFLPEATADYNGLVFADREALVSFMRENMGPGMVTLHQVHHPEIAVDGDDATARWYLQDKVIVEEFRFMLEGAAFYEDRYRRTPQGWRVEHTGYVRTYEMTYSLDDIPGVKVNGPGIHTH